MNTTKAAKIRKLVGRGFGFVGRTTAAMETSVTADLVFLEQIVGSNSPTINHTQSLVADISNVAIKHQLAVAQTDQSPAVLAIQ